MFGFFRKSTPKPPEIIRSIGSVEDLDAVLDHSRTGPVLLFKHSATCGTSFFARREVERLTEGQDPPVFELVVQRSRLLSQHIAHHFGIRHESPQAILVIDRLAVWNASHGAITTEAVRSAIAAQ